MGPGGAKLLVVGGTGGTPAPAALLYPIAGPVSISVGWVSGRKMIWNAFGGGGTCGEWGNNCVPDVDVLGQPPI